MSAQHVLNTQANPYIFTSIRSIKTSLYTNVCVCVCVIVEDMNVIVFVCIIPSFIHVDYKDMPQGNGIASVFYAIFGICICHCGCVSECVFMHVCMTIVHAQL